MTSRTNRHSGGQNPGGTGEVAPLDFEKRRQLAVKRYLDGDEATVSCKSLDGIGDFDLDADADPDG